MTSIPNADRYADEQLLDPVDDEIDEWTLDELELSADLASVRAASTRSEAWLGMGWCRGCRRSVIAAPGPTHHATSWATAFRTLLDALVVASAAAEIWVAAGRY